MDILEELPIGQWPQLQAKLKALWPTNVPGYYSLHVNTKYPGVREAFNFKVYCPYGDIDNGFVAINVKGYQDVILFSITEDTTKLEEALTKTKIIDWNKNVFFDLVTSITFPALERVRAVMQFEKFRAAKVKMYHLGGNTKLLMALRLPTGTYMSSVQPENIERVNDMWPHKFSYSHAYFTTLAVNGLSYGLYSIDSKELLAWVFINEYNYLSHLYCEEKHRRRGYAEYVMYCAVNYLLKDGHDAYAYVVDGNKKPLKIFEKFGFRAVDDAAFINMAKYVNKSKL